MSFISSLFGPPRAFETACECGYDGRTTLKLKAESDCTEPGIGNHYKYPAFRDLPDENDADDRYYDFSGGVGMPRRHWCFYAQVKEAGCWMGHRMRVMLETRFGEILPLAFHLEGADTPQYFQWSDLKKEKSTMCILYPYIRNFMDGTQGIRQENPNTVMVFPASQNVLREEVNKIIQALGNPGKCSVCNEIGAKKCSNCKVCHVVSE